MSKGREGMITELDAPAGQLAGLAAMMNDRQRTAILERVGLVDQFCVSETPIGPVTVAFNDRGISFLSDTLDEDEFRRRFADRVANRALRSTSRTPRGLVDALRTGRGRHLTCDLRGLSDFGQAVLSAARDIPVGEVRSYRWIASRIGRPNAVRAVGTALGANPVPIVIPCHRVIRSDGSPGEYLLGSSKKDALIRHEGTNIDEIAELHNRGIRYVASDTTHVFCEPSCHHARRITPPHRLLVRSADEAGRNGLRPCRTCQPIPIPRPA